MALLFEEYEKSSARTVSHSSLNSLTAGAHTGFLNSPDDECPIFNKQKITNINLSSSVRYMAVSANTMLVYLEKSKLLRIELTPTKNIEEIELPQNVGKITHLFLDPSGKHALLSMSQGDVFYLFKTAKKLKPINKMKGHLITAVAWNSQNTQENLTGPILLGSSKGLIFESEISGSTDRHLFQAAPEQYFKQVYDLTWDSPNPLLITGLAFEKYSSEQITESKYWVIVTTPNRIYQFLGTIATAAEAPILFHVFDKYTVTKELYNEFPGNLDYSDLKLFYPKKEEPKTSSTSMEPKPLPTSVEPKSLPPSVEPNKPLPTSMAWMISPGILYGEIDYTGKKQKGAFIVDKRFLDYNQNELESEVPPLAIILTEFHVLILYPDRLKAICVLNDLLVFEDIFTERHQVLGICRDMQEGNIWSFAGHNIYKYKVFKESRYVWPLYLEKKEFKLAEKYCEDNPASLNLILTKQAENEFQNKRYNESAILYAKTENSFEEISLKFLQVHEEIALKYFLREKLAKLKASERTQITMLVLWLIEIYLHYLGKLRDSKCEVNDEKPKIFYKELQAEFHSFLMEEKIKESVGQNRNIIYELMASHGNQKDLFFFASLMEDHERVIRYHIQNEKYQDALISLQKQNNVELFYQFSPVLMQHIPKETVKVWKSRQGWLCPSRLIPALVQYDDTKGKSETHEGIVYLEFCAGNIDNKDPAIHNYLLALYAKLNPKKLLEYLYKQGQDPSCVYYDLKYALRLCSEYNHHKACVHIYRTMGLYEEAVDLALKVDVEIAKQTADLSEDNDELRKKLWLRIARHVVEEEKDIKKAMDFIQECDLIKIEDILPFFPDFVTIDHFKDAICDSLTEYNKHIDMLKKEMTEATESAKEIRTEIQAFRNKYSFVKAQDKCFSCSNPILTRAFYLFPCQHLFHSDCLLKEVKPCLSISNRNSLDEIQYKMSMLNKDDTVSTSSSTSGTPMLSKKEQLKAKMDDIIASECLYCGDYMIKCIDKPFIEAEEYDEVMKSWE